MALLASCDGSGSCWKNNGFGSADVGGVLGCDCASRFRNGDGEVDERAEAGVLLGGLAGGEQDRGEDEGGAFHGVMMLVALRLNQEEGRI